MYVPVEDSRDGRRIARSEFKSYGCKTARNMVKKNKRKGERFVVEIVRRISGGKSEGVDRPGRETLESRSGPL